MDRKNRMRILLGLCVLVLAPIVGFTVLSMTARRPTNLGVVDGRLAPCPDSPNCVSTQATDSQHQIAPLRFEGTPEEAKQRLTAALATIPRLRIITETDDYLHAEVTSRLFRFVDDVEFFVDRPGKVIHFRSASRVGRSDLGVNRDRMEQIRTAFQK